MEFWKDFYQNLTVYEALHQTACKLSLNGPWNKGSQGRTGETMGLYF